MKKTLFFIGALLAMSALIFGAGISNQTVMNQTLVNEINSANAQANLPWTAALDNNFNGKTIQELSVMDGWRPLPAQMRNDILNRHLTTTDNMLMGFYTMFDPLTMNSSTIPTDYDIRDVNGRSYVTPVKDQGFHGYCWAYSTTESIETAMMFQNVVSEFPFINGATPVLSTQFTAYHDVDWDLLSASNYWAIQDSNYDAGGSQYFAMYNAVRYGTPLASDFPGDAYDNSPWVLWDPQTTNWQDHLVHINGTALLLGAVEEKAYYGVSYDQYIDAIKSMILKYGSVSVAFMVPSDFFGYSTGVYVPATPVSYEGGHAVQIVGWKDNVTASNGVTYPTVWIVRNSWGTSWGMDGYWMQPAVTPAEYASGNVPNWKFEATGEWLYSPIFEPATTDWTKADFNGDGVVNSTDFNMLKAAMAETNPSSATIAKYDISVPQDYRIDGNDLIQFMYLWNEAAKAGK